MCVSFGERLVRKEVDNLREKLRGVGGRNLGPHDKVAEINHTLREIRRIQKDLKSDQFFRTEEFKRIVKGLESMLEPSIISV